MDYREKIDSQLQDFTKESDSRLTVPTALAFHHCSELRNAMIEEIFLKQRPILAAVRRKLMIAAFMSWLGRNSVCDQNRIQLMEQH